MLTRISQSACAVVLNRHACRSSIVKNDCLAFMACHWKLHRCLLHSSPALHDKIEGFAAVRPPLNCCIHSKPASPCQLCAAAFRTVAQHLSTRAEGATEAQPERNCGPKDEHAAVCDNRLWYGIHELDRASQSPGRYHGICDWCVVMHICMYSKYDVPFASRKI